MKTLLPKINLLKDISIEYASSAKSVEIIQGECENLLNRLEFELTLRLEEKGRFITKVGVGLRELLLENYRGFINRIHHEYCRNEEILFEMVHQYRNLQETIHNAEFSFEELKKLKRWAIQESNFMNFKNNSKVYNQSIMLNKENLHYQPINFEKNTFKLNEWKTEQNNHFKRQKRWPIMAQNKSRKDQLYHMQKKLQQAQIADLDSMIEDCLSSLADFTFLTQRKKLEKDEIKSSQYLSQPSPYQAANNASHGISLGLQSLNDEVNLLCTEQIDDFSLSRTQELQKITQREEEYSQSSLNQTPNKECLLS